MRFVLVHGGGHGAWAWDRLAPELEALGHETVAMDLPGHGERQAETATVAGYRDAVVEHMRPRDVLVGHSMGGHVVTLAADARPDLVGHVVYLAGGLPLEGRCMNDSVVADDEVKDAFVSERAQRHTRIDEETASIVVPTLEDAASLFFHDCDDSVAAWAFGRLTPQQLAPLMEPISVPAFWRADMPRSFIRCTEDRAMQASTAAAFIARLNVEPLLIEASHSPFLSRPRETAELLVHAVATKPLGPPRPN